jgi:hypothetical protein
MRSSSSHWRLPAAVVPFPIQLAAGCAQEAASRIARRVLAGSSGIDALLGYSIMLESWDLENELATTGYVGNPADLKPYRLLTGLAAGNGGHLAPLLATL